MDTRTLIEWINDARARTCALIADLDDEQLMGPRLPTVNPLLWEIGHVTWFQEKWVLRHTYDYNPIRTDADALYDSTAIPHDTRWNLPLPSHQDTLSYLHDVRDRVIEHVENRKLRETEIYFALLSVFHEDMHAEAFTMTRQTLAYPPPRLEVGVGPRIQYGATAPSELAGALPGDIEIPGGTWMLGAARDEPFVFDNEKWAHPVSVEPFAIARAPVTQSEFAVFVNEGAYRQRRFWSYAGWAWKETVAGEHPVYWQRGADCSWQRRHFDGWVPLEPHQPMVHVNWHEAQAFCRWANRRLPTEAELEVAASGQATSDGSTLAPRKRRFPWGDDQPHSRRANMDETAKGCVDVAALPEGDSALGCRQMIGNVWEWTASDFLPYPGFVPDPYKEYSQPWFGTHKVLRGGCWATRSRLIRNTWRNFYEPHRRDIFAGFRTCAVT